MRTNLLALTILVAAAPARADVLLTSLQGSYAPVVAHSPGTGSPYFLTMMHLGGAPPAAVWDLGPNWIGVAQRRTANELRTLAGVPNDPNVIQCCSTPNSELQFGWSPDIQGKVFHNITLPHLWISGGYVPPFGGDYGWQITSSFTPPNGYNLSGSGYTLSAMDFVLNSFTVDHFTDPNSCTSQGECNTYPVYSFSFTTSIYGVPEPGSTLLMLLTAASLAARRRRR